MRASESPPIAHPPSTSRPVASIERVMVPSDQACNLLAEIARTEPYRTDHHLSVILLIDYRLESQQSPIEFMVV